MHRHLAVPKHIVVLVVSFFAATAAWLLLSVGQAGPVPGQSPKTPWLPADLLRAADDEPPLIASLFRALGRPSDRVKLSDGDVVDIEPLGPDSLLDPDFAGTVVAKAIAQDNQPGRQLELTRAGAALLPYERQVLDRIVEFERSAGEIPAMQRLTALQSALAAVLRFSLSTRQRPLKGTGLWEAVQNEVDRKLLEVRRLLLRERCAASRSEEEWRKALRLGDELVAAYGENATVLADVARLRTRYAASVLLHMSGGKNAAKDYAIVRRQLEWVDEHLSQPLQRDPVETLRDALLQAGQPVVFHFQPDAEALRQILVRKAANLMARATAKQTKDKAEAVKLLETAKEIWPRLPGLEDELLKRQGRYGKLYVGVRTLPRHLSPASAATDSEMQALELLFESLVQARPTPDGSLAFVPELAASLPQMADNLRRFQLRKSAFWSTGARVTGADVQRTWELLTNPKLPGHSAELADRLEPIRGVDNAFRWDATLRQGQLDPLAAFTFKVLPREFRGAPLASADDEAFAVAPVGSGRFMLVPGTHAEHGRTYVRFVTNPFFVSSKGSVDPNSHEIREILLFASHDPVADWNNKSAPCHLLLDVPTQTLGQLKAAGVSDLRTSSTRRVFFLAANQRDPVLADEALRRALAHAINRRQVLANCFGGGRPHFYAAPVAAWSCTSAVIAAVMRPEGATAHQPLNSPYPAGSWAAGPDNQVPANLFDAGAAAAFLKAAKGKAIQLDLKYPNEDPQVEAACKMIAVQLAELGEGAGRPIQVHLSPLPAHQLQRDVFMRNYQLAYWHHDFADDYYSLWPLFDPREQALATGSNYLGFKDVDGTLPDLLQKAGAYRDFAKVKELTHLVHALLYQRMPLIPLWQLDYHIAVHPALKLPRVDPLRVFANVDEWRLVGK